MRTKIISWIICALMIATIFVIEVPKGVNAQVTEEWVARYNGPSNGYDHGYAITTDLSGNIYVTGTSYGGSPYDSGTGYDYTTIKYDPDGNMLWVARYNGPGYQGDYPGAIATDVNGNVYVTGWSYGSGTTFDYATIKYDINGNEQWVSRYNGFVNERDRANAIAIDSLGNVYVTGQSGGTIRDYDYITIKYNSLGEELWVARYNGPENGDDYAFDLSIGLYGNIYVTGRSWGNATLFDYVTIAYDPDGNVLWIAKYNGEDNGVDSATDMAIDSSGNIYVTGWSYNNVTDYDFATVAYFRSNGSERWVTRYNSLINDTDSNPVLTTDLSGTIYVSGRSKGDGTDYDYATVAYDSFGNELWRARYEGPGNGPDYPWAIATDIYGNVYVTGWSFGNGTEFDFASLKYDLNGNELWVERYNGPGNDRDRAIAMTIDNRGNLYVTGSSISNLTHADFATIKYTQELPSLKITIDIDPNTLNLKSKGRWITCYITLNDPYDVNDIEISTILFEDTIPAEWSDIQNDTLMVKFDRSEVEDMVPPGIYNLKVTGELADGTLFEGYSDEIRVIDPGK